MKIGVFAVLFGNKPFEETLDYLVELGVEAVEIGNGRVSGQRALQSRRTAARARRKLHGVPRSGPTGAGWSSARSAATATRCIRKRKIARAHHDDVRADRRAGAEARRVAP